MCAKKLTRCQSPYSSSRSRRSRRSRQNRMGRYQKMRWRSWLSASRGIRTSPQCLGVALGQHRRRCCAGWHSGSWRSCRDWRQWHRRSCETSHSGVPCHSSQYVGSRGTGAVRLRSCGRLRGLTVGTGAGRSRAAAVAAGESSNLTARAQGHSPWTRTVSTLAGTCCGRATARLSMLPHCRSQRAWAGSEGDLGARVSMYVSRKRIDFFSS